eukprot:1905977-Amphidinium_carterae.3
MTAFPTHSRKLLEEGDTAKAAALYVRQKAALLPCLDALTCDTLDLATWALNSAFSEPPSQTDEEEGTKMSKHAQQDRNLKSSEIGACPICIISECTSAACA